MVATAVRLWFKLLLLGATALLGAVLLVSTPASAQPTTAPYGPATTPSTVAPTTAAPVAKPAAIAFTGADIAAMATVGAVAIGVGGTLILVTRRRRSEQSAAS
jgi:hypothetical protein